MPRQHDVAGGGGAEARALEQALQLVQTRGKSSIGRIGWAQHDVAAAAAGLAHEQVEERGRARAAYNNAADAADAHSRSLVTHARPHERSERRRRRLLNKLYGA